MQIKTIVTDCDDTLLTDDLTITPFTREVLKRAHAKGIRIILASGRAPASLAPFVTSLNFSDPYIACNGAVIVDGQTHLPLDEVNFTVPMAHACARFYKENNMYAQYYLGNKFYYSTEGDLNRNYSAATRMEGVFVGDLEKSITQPIMKLLGMDTIENTAIAYEKAMAAFADTCSITMSKPYFLEMNPKGGTKGEALERLSKLIAISPDTTMAFGDSLNDLSMLKWAKYGVAMANARDEVKAAVSLHCQSNMADGVAKMILTHVLKEDYTQ